MKLADLKERYRRVMAYETDMAFMWIVLLTIRNANDGDWGWNGDWGRLAFGFGCLAAIVLYRLWRFRRFPPFTARKRNEENSVSPMLGLFVQLSIYTLLDLVQMFYIFNEETVARTGAVYFVLQALLAFVCFLLSLRFVYEPLRVWWIERRDLKWERLAAEESDAS